MIEWIVLLWVSPCWPTSSWKCSYGDATNFYVSSTTAQFEQKWNSLSGKERETARVFWGNEPCVRTSFEFQDRESPVKLKDGVPTYQWELVLRDLEYTSADPDTEESTRKLANATIKSIRTLLQNRAFDAKMDAIEKKVRQDTEKYNKALSECQETLKEVLQIK